MGDVLHHCSYDHVNGFGVGTARNSVTSRDAAATGTGWQRDTQVQSPSALPRVVSASPTAPLLRWILPCVAPPPALAATLRTNGCGTEGDNDVNSGVFPVTARVDRAPGYPQKIDAVP